MNLAARRSARQREDFVMRLGSVLVAVAVLASLVLEPPRAKAEALTLAAVGGVGLLGAYLAACGMTPYATGMDRNGANEALARTVQEFLDDTFGPGSSEPSGGGSNKPSLNDWLGMIAFTVSNGVVRFGKEAVDKLNQFASWVASKYGTKAGENVVYVVPENYVVFADGTKFYLSEFNKISATKVMVTSVGSMLEVPSDLPVYLSTGYCLASLKDDLLGLYSPNGNATNISGKSYPYSLVICLDASGASSDPVRIGALLDGNFLDTIWLPGLQGLAKVFGDTVSIDESLALDVAETITIPEGLTDGQSVALDVGATGSMSIQDILQGILDAILAGDLAASAEIVDEATEPVDPEEPDPPVVPVIPEGLDQLGAALTSRFPFSIPWDVYKGVTLLAAPPKAPYFEVDFLAPIADRVGGWKGSTKIVLDFSEYEIIGQVCRWTSTIGFCLMLAAGTKRLIWTA